MGLVQRMVMTCAVGGTLGIGLGCGSGKTTTPPSIGSFSPLQAPVGNDLIITGAGFTGTTSVSINGLAVSAFTVNTDAQITAFIPLAASSGAITVVNAGGTSTTNASFFVMPSITSLSTGNDPSGLTMSTGQTVTLAGAGFIGATAVSFAGPASAPASYPATSVNVASANQMTVTVPTAPAGTGYLLQVTVPGSPNPNTASSPAFTIQ